MSEGDAVPPGAAPHPVTSEALPAQAHRPVLPRPRVLPRLAVRVGAARVGAAEIRGGEGTTRDEGVTWTSGVIIQTQTVQGPDLCEFWDTSRLPCIWWPHSPRQCRREAGLCIM